MLGDSQKLCATFLTWKPKVKAFQIIADTIPNNRKIHVYMSELKKEISHFDFNVIQIKKSVKINHIAGSAFPMCHFIKAD